MGTPKLLSGPAYLTASAANVYAGAGGVSANYDLVRHIRLVNTDTVDRTCILYKGATGGSTGGTEIFDGTVPTLDAVDVYFPSGLYLSSTDFISGLAASASKITVTLMGDRNVI